jgi:chromosome segregation ATPase
MFLFGGSTIKKLNSDVKSKDIIIKNTRNQLNSCKDEVNSIAVELASKRTELGDVKDEVTDLKCQNNTKNEIINQLLDEMEQIKSSTKLDLDQIERSHNKLINELQETIKFIKENDLSFEQHVLKMETELGGYLVYYKLLSTISNMYKTSAHDNALDFIATKKKYLIENLENVAHEIRLVGSKHDIIDNNNNSTSILLKKIDELVTNNNNLKKNEFILKKKMEQSKKEIFCNVCLNNKVDKVMGCGHVLCAGCLGQICSRDNVCPFCRTPIRFKINLYLT